MDHMPIERCAGDATEALGEATHLGSRVGEGETRVLHEFGEAQDALSRANQLHGLSVEADVVSGYSPARGRGRRPTGRGIVDQVVDHVTRLGDPHVARAFGDSWVRERRTAVLVVPSVVARRERNVLLNPQHAEFKKIVAGSPEPVVWDARLFARR